MSDAPVISVRGEAVLEADPEIARLSVYVQSKEDDRRTALDQLVRRNQQCLDLVRSYGEAVERVETGALTITPVLKYRRREGDIAHYQGTAWIKVTVADLTVLGELVTRLGNLERTRVDGPEWALRRDSPVYAEAARQAVRQAVERARSYADALGCRLTGMVELSDEGLGHDGVEPLAAMPVAYAGAMNTPEEPEAISLEPSIQTVRAAVEARFTTTQPELA
ncbi:hypothetical protein SAMN04489712_102421 [Thermomonospora echinospora]|uniref:DUF541 domain-containing protein n=1 Tax=Thermomonospora echinospora TaxID=1992 RepID=A0A1H5VQQ5_9ACTN|nr:SIMPL domain-containing protein [Thermomonospora echinospora]SEF89655.1 hypothetical protein SAMN04489712_102421 [Thermomonospora echinospora]